LTTDAYVQAYVIQVAPEVPGRVVRVPVREGEQVKAGALLFELDARPFAHKVAFLEARLIEVKQQVKQLGADLATARADQERAEADTNFAGAVFSQEKQIFKTESTTERPLPGGAAETPGQSGNVAGGGPEGQARRGSAGGSHRQRARADRRRYKHSWPRPS